MLASASNAIVIVFNVRTDMNAQKAAKAEKVDVRLHRVIYKAIEEIEAAMKGMLDPEYEEKVIGQAEVREIFKVSRIDRKSTRLNSSHVAISYAVFCLKKKKKQRSDGPT